ncbi:RidA family protein [Streptomyces xylophagus]|uniref:RidA family protein n=1 Tax=Streptomyces xylophagus TaxID=285514 RepID=UPI0005B7F7E8|nr:RidA family protein [Streptomyces xylophagus]
MSVSCINPPELPPLPGVLSHAVAVPELGLVYTSGQVAWDKNGELVGGDDLAAQFEKAYDNVELALRAAGSSRERIIKETIYIAGYTTDRAAELVGMITAARKGTPTPPASTAVGVASLYTDGFLVEIEVVATL